MACTDGTSVTGQPDARLANDRSLSVRAVTCQCERIDGDSESGRAPCKGPSSPAVANVTGGVTEALDRARDAAGGKDVAISGGAGAARQYIAAGLLDEILIHLVPVFLGEGVRLFDSPALAAIEMEQESAVEAPGVAHLAYRIVHR